MNIKTAIAAAAIAAPALLLSGTGVAQARQVRQSVGDALGVRWTMQSVGGMKRATAGRLYARQPWSRRAAAAAAGLQRAVLPGGNQNYRLWFPGIQTGTK